MARCDRRASGGSRGATAQGLTVSPCGRAYRRDIHAQHMAAAIQHEQGERRSPRTTPPG